MKTVVYVKLTIEHDTEETKQQGLDVWCEGLKKGQYVRGSNGVGEHYSLIVDDVKEIKLKNDTG